MTNGDVLERYRAMLETPSILAVDPSALLRDMAAEIERHRSPRADMNEKAINKQCTRCGETKPLDAFARYKNVRGQMYTWARCRDCVRAYYRSPRRKRKASANYARYQADGRLREKQARAAKVYAAKHPEKIKAGRIMKQAIKMGRLIRPDACEKCGDRPGPKRNGASRIQGHHDDYSKPLEVRWLCQWCHAGEHPK